MCGSLLLSASELTVAKYTVQHLTNKTPLSTMVQIISGHPFNGFLRYESLQTTWKGRIRNSKKVEIEGFTEQGVTFRRHGKVAIAIVDDFDGRRTARIVTTKADPEVKKVHSRMPKLYR